eukprot:TRINITY_DN25673_c0_g1_i2.p1 TRINITY_DN25673_c0_g1~~TRINITY_DN25673_c0_g1_i2.p1  ORF type:complete len:310 (+),score=37.49 TRINITY_DN25673_c0_g1_i2:81-1010(+)
MATGHHRGSVTIPPPSRSDTRGLEAWARARGVDLDAEQRGADECEAASLQLLWWLLQPPAAVLAALAAARQASHSSSVAVLVAALLCADTLWLRQGGAVDEPPADCVDLEEEWCALCRARRPLRSRHCRKCRRCVRTYDHHCPWIGNCVGERNHAAFWWFLLCTAVALVAAVHLWLNGLTSAGGWRTSKIDAALTAAVFAGIVTLLPVWALLVGHTGLILNNVTTFEFMRPGSLSYLRRLPPRAAPFHRGELRNVWVACCASGIDDARMDEEHTAQVALAAEALSSSTPRFNWLDNGCWYCCCCLNGVG